MILNSINYCTFLTTGKCNNLRCLLVHTKKCKYNLLCDSIKCNLNHDCCYKKRLFIIKINNLFNKYIKNNECLYFLYCIDNKCNKNHLIDFKDRLIIYNIIYNNNNINLDNFYNKIFNKYNFKSINKIDNIISDISIQIEELYNIIINKIKLLNEKKKIIKENNILKNILINKLKY
jgi:hypothetical protein